MATNNFLDQAGLSYLWAKVLSAIESHSVTLPDKLVSYKAAMTITATEKLNADTLGGYSATYFAKGADVSMIQETIRTQASEILKAQQAVSSMESTVSSLAKNKANSVHAARHAKDGADPITPESIGAAPGGFGLGGNATNIPAGADLNSYVKIGRYAQGTTSIMRQILNLPDAFSNGGIVVDVLAINPTYVMQIAYNLRDNKDIIIAMRQNYIGTWQPWELVNPPMNLGTEYRTTERYLGKPVYTKVVNCGNLPDGTTTEVAHGIANVGIVVGAQAIASNSDTGFNGLVYLPSIYNGSLTDRWTVYLAGVDYQKIRIFCGGGLAGRPVYVTLKYTKTTD